MHNLLMGSCFFIFTFEKAIFRNTWLSEEVNKTWEGIFILKKCGSTFVLGVLFLTKRVLMTGE